ncbi:MAG: cupin domain-containing protein [Azospirillaceae bacterium]|nr:cupin domain-containing protein [Azospirillaceae bacterium]
MPTPQDIVTTLGMQPHPEGGYFVETFRDPDPPQGRGSATAIYYLLESTQISAWHRIDAVEIWHWYAGSPLALMTRIDDGLVETTILGNRLEALQRPQAVVSAGVWQSAISLGAWTLVGCTVSPAFRFAGFELATPGRFAP